MKNTAISHVSVQTPLGSWRLELQHGAITRFSPAPPEPDQLCPSDAPAAAEAVRQIQEYFDGNRAAFDLPLSPAGTEFQQAVWSALQTIPRGETRSYGELAAMLDRPKAARAVGGACHRNPILLLIPCHRVVGSRGELTGFAAGVEVKRWLLEMEMHNA